MISFSCSSIYFLAMSMLLVLHINSLETENFHINRYFLQIDNIFDYKRDQVLNSFPPNVSYELFVEEDWMLQPLDHFDPLEDRHFWQKYLFQPPLKRCGSLCSKSPICVFIGGDVAIHPYMLEHIFLAERCAEEFGGHLFLVEHRIPRIMYVSCDPNVYAYIDGSKNRLTCDVVIYFKSFKGDKKSRFSQLQLVGGWFNLHKPLYSYDTSNTGQTNRVPTNRFYGESMPAVNLTLDILRYLNVPQALEDISAFIVYIRKQYKLEKNKLFVFGASYGGTLAALFRRKYAHLADAAVALSAPMMNEYQNKEYLPSVGKKIKKIDRMCYMFIEHGLRQATRLMENHICSKKDYPMCDKIRENLGYFGNKLCSSLKGMSKQERRIFFSTLIKDFAFLAEYDGVLDVSLKNICSVITHQEISEWSPMDKLLAGDIVISQELFRSKTRAGFGTGECLEAKKQVICNYFRNDSLNHESTKTGRRQRLWQSCAELGSFFTSNGDSRHHPFGAVDVLPASFHQEFCACAFGDRLSQSFTTERIRAYQKTFGSFLPTAAHASPFNSGSRIIYTIGEDDPVLQRELKIAEKPGMKAKYNENVIFKVKGSAHCGEVFIKPTRKRMKPRLVSVVQQEILEQLTEWLRLQ